MNTSPADEIECEPRKKKFNLKKQITKLDLKIKVPPKNNKRSGSIFYTEKESGEDSPPNSLSPDEEVPAIKVAEGEEKAIRPTDLPLFEDKPIRPPRREKKDKPTRDTRLLSVPNIKYQPRGSPGFSAFKRKTSKSKVQKYEAIQLFLIVWRPE